MFFSSDIAREITAFYPESLSLLQEFAQIPAPSNHEELRAQFCKKWLDANGAQGVYIDEALNVVYPIGCDREKPITVLMAHSDVVFPDIDPLLLTVDDEKIYCPGIGDDSANVVALLTAAKYIATHCLMPRKHGVLLVINSGEEGLGNLKGCRKIMHDYGPRIQEFISFDATNGSGINHAVGSHRYHITVYTEGGHSYNSFGNRNAIAALAALINDLYAVQLPTEGKTTFNVGTINGGTSVNTIAQQAEMLYEYRSDTLTSLTYMENAFTRMIDSHRQSGLSITVERVGERPCSGAVDPIKMAALQHRVNDAYAHWHGKSIAFTSGSTDCNIPLSLGIPSVCVGCCNGSGTHTREEYVEISSLLPGLLFCCETVLHYF